MYNFNGSGPMANAGQGGQGGQSSNNGIPDWLASALGIGGGLGKAGGGLWNMFSNQK